mmetsp:Transcript_18876/g.58623  ORF Transcript_18876/g.58623 Transcript_18876/m.58623 type:complete len:240 (-) Transcript_18876:633-1352(-)
MRAQGDAGRRPDRAFVDLRAALGRRVDAQGARQPRRRVQRRPPHPDQRVQNEAARHRHVAPVREDLAQPHLRWPAQQRVRRPGAARRGQPLPGVLDAREGHRPREAPARRQPPRRGRPPRAPARDLEHGRLARRQVRLHRRRPRLQRARVARRQRRVGAGRRAVARRPLHRRHRGRVEGRVHERGHRLLLLRADPRAGRRDDAEALHRRCHPVRAGPEPDARPRLLPLRQGDPAHDVRD